MEYSFFNSCVNWDRSDVDAPGGLRDMIDSGRHVTRATLRRNIGSSVLKAFEVEMGYPCGRLTMAKDYAVSYSRGKMHGKRVYWINHYAIEYVFHRNTEVGAS